MGKSVKNFFATIIFCFFGVQNCVSMEDTAHFKREDYEFRIGTILVRQTHFNEIDSTQIWSIKNIKMMPETDKNIWRLITADVQTAGIGMSDRKWISHIPGNVYASLSFLTPAPVLSETFSSFDEWIDYDETSQLFSVSAPLYEESSPDIFEIVSSVAVSNVMVDMLQGKGKVQIKWPSDVIVDEKKISGTMVNLSSAATGWNMCTIGVGVNVNFSEKDLSVIDQPATSMGIITQKTFNEKEVLRCYLSKFDEAMNSYKKDQETFLSNFFGKMAFIGEIVDVHDDISNTDITGRMLVVTESGFLRLQKEKSGSIVEITSGILKKH